ncbi:translational activator [Cucurbitaria berberidis CBS 394.84]|uniref:eIF-2-alpha kinase activator GCN1 n=1 Tax=Cucurbitaria berberidis CBS 394.84 TaxID=1168544 RepID=A0A9P4GL38_9PLEO|nr:translational activator [Cucurbitaria berberidis CBS 394.84]KAF1848328.1 translational activator [Cucurbitaria berberidis CBS 394.84]
MSVNGDAKSQAIDRAQLRQRLITSSTKRRRAELSGLQHQVADDSLVNADLQALLELLFETYPLYDDRESRRAVEEVLKSLVNGPHGETVLPAIVKFLKQECLKKGIAHVNAFVLVDWCSVLLLQFAKSPERWSKYGLDVALANARVLETCVGVGTDRRAARISESALVSTRRALRAIFRSEAIGQDALSKLVTTLTAKGSVSTAGNSVFLGVIAGVSSRLPIVKTLLEQHKHDYYTFYIREVVGSRNQLPDHVSNALHDFFDSFPTLEELRKEVILPIEKALLRAPEVVLNDIVSPMILALPESMDLSDILLGNLLKPLLSNVKSSNPAIRAGALRTFKALASRSRSDDVIGKVADEILNPLKQGKVTGADQKVLHAQMLSVLPELPSLSKKIPAGIAPVALKEPSEPAVVAEVSAMVKHLTFGLANGEPLDKTVTDAFLKGMADKRVPVRRLWAIRAADIWWNLSDAQHAQQDVLAFCQATLPKLVEIWQEVNANPIPATQSGLVTVGHYVAALLVDRVRNLKDEKLVSIFKKSDILSQSLATQPKPSFILNPKVYSKLSTEDDVVIAVRALTAVAPFLDQGFSKGAEDAWAQAFIFFIVAQGVSAKGKSAAKQALTQTYLHTSTARISSIMIEGLWSWYRSNEQGDKDSAAVASRTGSSELSYVLGCLCLPSESLKKLEISVDIGNLRRQAMGLVVLARPEIMPRVSWIELCLRMGIDPGQLVRDKLEGFVSTINEATQNRNNDQLPAISLAAYSAYTDIAFVAPEAALPAVVTQFSQDLDPKQLEAVGPTEAAIFRTPAGTVYIDVLSKKAPVAIDRNTKDYDTLKWEEELRAQLAQKKGQTKKLTADEQAKINAQLAKEAVIRNEVDATERKMRRGVGIIRSLATGPPTEAEQWMGPAVDLLIQSIRAGAGLLLGDLPATAFIACSQRISNRLGVLRPFVGVATLRTIGSIQLSDEYEDEDLGDLVTRVLYRLRFLSEQRPLDAVSLAYCFPVIFLVLEKSGIGRSSAEEADEQLVLAIEVLAFHTNSCTDNRLPRKDLLEILVWSMQRYQQHYKMIKDCLTDLASGLAPNITNEELGALLRGTIVPEAAVRTATLQAIDAELDMNDLSFSEEIWIACHDDVPENVELAQTIWDENELQLKAEAGTQMLPYLDSLDKQLRRAAARSIGEIITKFPDTFDPLLKSLQESYKEKAKPRVPERDEYGMPRKVDLRDPWESRDGIALAFKEMTPGFKPDGLVEFLNFLVYEGPLGDRSPAVREEMIGAATSVITTKAQTKVEPLMELFENALEGPDRKSEMYDQVNEAVIILYGALGRHLTAGDMRVPKIVQRLLATLSTPSETVQYAVAQCLPPLVRTSEQELSSYVDQMMEQLLQSKKYASRRGAAYGLAGLVLGKGLCVLKEYRIMSTFKGASENKKDVNQRQGVYLAYELLSLILGRLFEPYIIQLVPQLLAGFGDTSADVREACLDAAKTCFSTLSSFGVKQVLPILLEGLDDQQWRSKKGACDSLGAMAYLDPNQLALSLPVIIPPLTTVLTDSHKEVRSSANRSLQRFGEVISNPEIKSVVNILLKALSDPTKHTNDALDALIKIQFAHFLDAPSLALVSRILERGLGDRSGTKRKSAQIIGSLAYLTERKDLVSHLPVLVAGLRVAIVDPVPTTRATASKALGSLMEKLGEDALPDLIPSLMSTLKADTGAGDRLGSAQALSEVLAGLGTGRLEETLPSILQNVASNKPSVREGFMSLFIFLPACFGNSFANYLSKIIPPILGGLADDVESIRDTALRAGRLLVKNFATKAIDLLLPELERGLADDSHRIRLSSVELVGDLLFNLTGISGKVEEEEVEEGAKEAGQSLLEVLGEEKRNKVLSALYICRCDTSGLVRTAAINVWKALVATPRTLRELVPTLTQLLIRRLASSNMEQKVIAGNALGELIRKAGDGVLATLLPTLEEGLHTTDTDAKQGICIALRELIASASPEQLEDYEKTLIQVVRTALVDPNVDVREAAAEAFDALQQILGKRAVDQVLPYLLNLLRGEDDAHNALSALLTLLTDQARSNIILPNLLPTLLTSPMSAFNARAIASLAEVASSAMTRRLPNILNTIMDNIITSKDDELKSELESSFDKVLLSVDEYDGLNTAMSVMLALSKHDDERRRARADMHLAKFFAESEVDFSRYYPDLIRALLISFDDSDKEVIKAAWTALSTLTTKRLRKEEMESLVVSTRQTLNQVGVAGADLPGFSLPKGINAILPIFLQGLMNGSVDQRTQAALAISDIIDRTSAKALQPFVTQITGPLIRVVTERSTEVKAAILLTLNNLLEKIPTFLKPFLPQLQRTFAKSLADTSSDVLRARAAKALGTLIKLTPRVDPLIAELVTGSKTADEAVKTAMLKALFEVVSKAGKNMNESSRNAILSLIDTEADDSNDAMAITNARLLGALISCLPEDIAAGLLKSRVLTTHFNKASVLALNAILLDAPEALAESFADETVSVICQGIAHSQPFISDNAVLAAGKYLLGDKTTMAFDHTKPIFEALAPVIEPGHPVDTRRLALVVLRTVAREHNELVRPHIPLLIPPVFASVRDPVIPVKLSAEATFLTIFSVVDEESAVFDKYMAGPGKGLSAGQQRSMGDYFKRVALRLAGQARERKEAEGGAGGLGLSSDEMEDEREIWSVGKVELGDVFGEN